MTKFTFKEILTINLIGKPKFYLGIIIGLFSALIIFFLFLSTQAILIYDITLTEEKQYLFIPKDIFFYKYFFSFLSSSLGVLTTLVFWFKNLRPKNKRKLLLIRQSVTFSLLIFWVIFYMLARTPFFFYLEELNISSNFTIIFYLLPIVIFFQGWNIIIRVYKVKNWILISLSIAILTAFTLPSIKLYPTVEYAHELYLKRLSIQHSYIDKTILDAKTKYSIEYDLKTIKTLKQYNTSASNNQVRKIYKSFKRESKVTLDTIILAKMIVHNLKDYGYSNTYKLYPTANLIAKEILKNDVNSKKTKELFELLKEIILFINKTEKDYINTFEKENHTRLANYGYISKNITSRKHLYYLMTKEVISGLKKEKVYSNYLDSLPVLNPFEPEH